jgi:hypothetical protein
MAAGLTDEVPLQASSSVKRGLHRLRRKERSDLPGLDSGATKSKSLANGKPKGTKGVPLKRQNAQSLIRQHR